MTYHQNIYRKIFPILSVVIVVTYNKSVGILLTVVSGSFILNLYFVN
jgi:general stress protein CsbA